MWKSVSGVVLFAISVVSAQASMRVGVVDFREQQQKLEKEIRDSTLRNVTLHIRFEGRNPNDGTQDCYSVNLFGYENNGVNAKVSVCGATIYNVDQKRAEVVSIVSRTLLEFDEIIARRVDANAQTGSADAGDISFNNGRGLRLGGTMDLSFADLWVQAPGFIVKRHSDGETTTQWLRTRYAIKTVDRGVGDETIVARINATVWESSIKGDRDGLVSGAGLIRLGTLKVAGGVVNDPIESSNYFSNAEIELVGVGLSSTYAVSKDVGVFVNAAVGYGLRFIDQNKTKLSYASPTDIRVGLMIKSKLYLGGKFEMEIGGETMRTTYGGELMYHLPRRGETLGMAIEKTEHNGLDPLVIEPNGWNLNFGYFGRF